MFAYLLEKLGSCFERAEQRRLHRYLTTSSDLVEVERHLRSAEKDGYCHEARRAYKEIRVLTTTPQKPHSKAYCLAAQAAYQEMQDMILEPEPTWVPTQASALTSGLVAAKPIPEAATNVNQVIRHASVNSSGLSQPRPHPTMAKKARHRKKAVKLGKFFCTS